MAQKTVLQKIYFVIIIILILLTLAIVIYTLVNKNKESATQEKFDEAFIGCQMSGGQIATSSCCLSAADYPNTCLIGACGCAPENSHEVNICDCGPDKCFNGSECIDR
ncbi:MAG TPA: hypothetical protein PLB74_01910 [Candidatus Paceibacterota bacterium]|nr:hypothetical protein [Candidatus Paceibacterota bacterium]HON21690.1 hypothetical protein [Candidatus Paceibacterota bacterium]HOV88796.1 hypothetical protein [Candidatus Paceibacterota bacterium]